MARAVADRKRRRRAFLRALAEGGSVAAACAASRLKWSTLYLWRRRDAAFRAAWEQAAEEGAEALTARLEDAVIKRAIDGVEEPVLRRGKVVGTRQRYSDPLLMFALRELKQKRRPADVSDPAPPAPAPRPAAARLGEAMLLDNGVRVIVRRLSERREEDEPA